MSRRERRMQWQASQRRNPSAPGTRLGLPPSIPALSSVRIEIGALVLRGFEKRHASRIAAAFERSVEERLRAGAMPDSLRRSLHSTSLRLVPMQLRRGSNPVAIGEDLARSIVTFAREERRRGGLR